MYAKICLGYDGGVPAPAHGAQRPLFGQLYTSVVQQREVLHLWPLDFAISTVHTTSSKPLATLWRPTLSGVMTSEFGVGGVERALLAGQPRWVIQRWLCQPLSLADAKRQEAEAKSEKWRWA